MAVKASGTGSFLIPTAPAVGTTVAGGAANTFTTNAVQLIASTSAAIFITGLHVQLTSTSKPTYAVILLSTGASDGSIVGEFVVPYVYTAGAAGTQLMGFVPIWPPIAVAASTRIGCKSADSVGSLNHTVILQCINQSNVVAEGAINETVNVIQLNGSAIDQTSGLINANVKQISTDATAADNAEAFFDGTGYAGTGNVIPTVTTLTNLPAITANWLTAAGMADDASTEIANKVLDTDMTAHQTQGTLGQAIGDPAADTNTIYKAVVTDATGATVGVDVVAVKAETASIQTDTNDIQNRIPAALSGDGFMKADLKSIEDELTSGNNATLNLKQLNIQNGDENGVGVYVDASFGAFATAVSVGGVTAIAIDGQKHGVTIGGGESGNDNWHAIDIQSFSPSGGKSINAPQNIAVSDGNLTLAAIASAVWANATRTLTAISDSAGVTTLLTRITAALGIYTAADVRSSVGLATANLDTQLDALPTAAENAAAVLSAATANPIDANVQEVNDVTITGDGSATPWGPV